MRASTDQAENRQARRRYVRAPRSGVIALTPTRQRLLSWIVQFAPVSTEQLAGLEGLSLKAAREHLRVLFDAGLTAVIPVARHALAGPFAADGARVLFGSGPNIYVPTPLGARTALALGLVEEVKGGARLAPASSQHLAHELGVRDVLAWLTRISRAHPTVALDTWRMGGAAEIDLARPLPPKLVRPDAWFVLRPGARVLVGLVEVDRATERGVRRWSEKLSTYRALFASNRLQAVTGYSRARVLVTTPTAARRDGLTQLIAELAPPDLARRFWLVVHRQLREAGLTAPIWRRPVADDLEPLVPEGILPADPAHQESEGAGRG